MNRANIPESCNSSPVQTPSPRSPHPEVMAEEIKGSSDQTGSGIGSLHANEEGRVIRAASVKIPKKRNKIRPRIEALPGGLKAIEKIDPKGEASIFIIQLLRLLDDAEKQNFEDVVGWQPDGCSLKVRNIREFENKLLPVYYCQTKIRSFQRQVRTAPCASHVDDMLFKSSQSLLPSSLRLMGLSVLKGDQREGHTAILFFLGRIDQNA